MNIFNHALIVSESRPQHLFEIELLSQFLRQVYKKVSLLSYPQFNLSTESEPDFDLVLFVNNYNEFQKSRPVAYKVCNYLTTDLYQWASDEAIFNLLINCNFSLTLDSSPNYPTWASNASFQLVRFKQFISILKDTQLTAVANNDSKISIILPNKTFCLLQDELWEKIDQLITEIKTISEIDLIDLSNYQGRDLEETVSRLLGSRALVDFSHRPSFLSLICAINKIPIFMPENVYSFEYNGLEKQLFFFDSPGKLLDSLENSNGLRSPSSSDGVLKTSSLLDFKDLVRLKANRVKIHASHGTGLNLKIGFLAVQPEHYIAAVEREFINAFSPSCVYVTFQTGAVKDVLKFMRLILLGELDLAKVDGWSSVCAVLLLGLCKLSSTPYVISFDNTRKRENTNPIKKLVRYMIMKLVAQSNCLLPGGEACEKYIRTEVTPTGLIKRCDMTVDIEKLQFEKTAFSNVIKTREQIFNNPNAKVLLFVGRLEPEKGLDVLFEAFDEINDPDLFLLIAGKGSLKNYVINAASKNPNLVYAGFADTFDLSFLHALSDIQVVPSKFEPWGLVVNEAISNKVPLICSDAVGCAEELVLRPGVGLVFKSESAKDLVQKIKLLAYDANFYRQIKDRLEQFSFDWTAASQAEKIFSALEAITKSKPDTFDRKEYQTKNEPLIKQVSKSMISSLWPKKKFNSQEIPLIILCYHSVGLNSLWQTVSRDSFRRQMEFLLNEFEPTALSNLIDLSGFGESVKPKFIVTFDDGYVGVIDHGLDILMDLAIPATIFPVAGYLGKPAHWAPLYFELTRVATFEELRNWVELGFEIGSHGLSHLKLPGLPKSKIIEELASSKSILSSLQENLAFCYPYGVYNNMVVDEVKKAGYFCGLAGGYGLGVRQDFYKISRITIGGSDTIESFQRKIYGQYNWLQLKFKSNIFLENLKSVAS